MRQVPAPEVARDGGEQREGDDVPRVARAKLDDPSNQGATSAIVPWLTRRRRSASAKSVPQREPFAGREARDHRRKTVGRAANFDGALGEGARSRRWNEEMRPRRRREHGARGDQQRWMGLHRGTEPPELSRSGSRGRPPRPRLARGAHRTPAASARWHGPRGSEAARWKCARNFASGLAARTKAIGAVE